MKYMGSKLHLLKDGLREVIDIQCRSARRFVDLFAGSAAVSHYVAQKFDLPVLSIDLQEFAVVLAKSVISRVDGLEWEPLWSAWKRRALMYAPNIRPPEMEKVTRTSVKQLQDWSQNQVGLPLTSSYGGYYYSPEQSVWLDRLRVGLPEREPHRTVALAALIHAASSCAASPGHTAQPLRPTRNGRKYIEEAWKKGLPTLAAASLQDLCSKWALRKGNANVDDANVVSRYLKEGDLVFIDPPYSNVQYSRFYHVLEAIAAGAYTRVSGIGRYPERQLRPISKYSSRKYSLSALDALLKNLAERKARAIVTFPDHVCSNGLSGSIISDRASVRFDVTRKEVKSMLSTLGGPKLQTQAENSRQPNIEAKMLVLTLIPRTR